MDLQLAHTRLRFRLAWLRLLLRIERLRGVQPLRGIGSKLAD
jgi:hypothetical protein